MRNACFGASIFVSILVLAGCAYTEPTFLVTGQKVVRVTCATAVDGITTCFKRAGEICGPRGFTLFNWSGIPWDKPYPEPDTLKNDPDLTMSGLLVACGT